MPDLFGSPADPDDAGLGPALRDVAGWGERHARLPGPARARRSAGIRRTTLVAGVGLLTAVAVVGTVLGVRTPGGQDPPAPAAPTTSATSATDGPSGPSAPPKAGDIDIDLARGLPTLAEGGVGPVAGLPGRICPGRGLPDPGAATDTTYVQASGPEYRETHGLLVFPDAEAAIGHLTVLQDQAADCATAVPDTDGTGARQVLREPIAGPWGSGLTLLLVDLPPAGAAEPVVGSWLLVGRIGRAVAVRYVESEYLLVAPPTRIDPAVLTVVRRPLDALAPGLCRWTADGC